MNPLFKHQSDAIDFAISTSGNCAIFHDPGLGKTRTCIEIFKHFKVKIPSLRLLVVCPLSLINAAWLTDVKTFSDFNAQSFKELDGSPDIVVMNYECLYAKKYAEQLQHLLQQGDWMCVLDESSRLKNNKSVTTKTLLKMASRFRHRIVASGTPAPNILFDYWGQVRFVNEFILPKSFYMFREVYGYQVDKWKYNVKESKRPEFMEKLSRIAHRVRKEDALDLPPKIEQIRSIDLSREEWKAYNSMKNHLIVELKDQVVTAMVAITKIMKLRQCTSGFMYTAEDDVVGVEDPTKLQELLELVEELGDQPLIIWAQFRYEIETITRLLRKRYGGTSACTLYGGTKDRELSIERFKNGQSRFLIAHPASAAHGLTFTNCSTMVFYSLDYSSERHTQAMDRIHRIGQTKSCLYIYLLAKNTIDEDIYNIIHNKMTEEGLVKSFNRN